MTLRGPSRGSVRFLGHFAAMVVAMVAGMSLLAPLWPVHPARPDLQALIMITDMSIGMTAWMAIRRYPRRSTAAMNAAMWLPFAVLLPPYWAGWLAPTALFTLAHGLMLPTMLAVMLRDHRLHLVTARTDPSHVDENLLGLQS